MSNVERVGFGELVEAKCDRPRGLRNDLFIQGYFSMEHWRGGKMLRHDPVCPNIPMSEGLKHMFNLTFNATGVQENPWYIGLVNTGASYAEGDTAAAHGGWTEITPYSGNRLDWTEGAATDAGAGAHPVSITNAATVDFAITSSATVAGAFLDADNTGTAGILFCAADFTGGDVSVVNLDTLKVTYTLTAT